MRYTYRVEDMDYLSRVTPDTPANRQLRSLAKIFEGRTMFIVSDPNGGFISMEGNGDVARRVCRELNSKLFDTRS